MKYLMLVYVDESLQNDAERSHCYEASMKLIRELQTRKQFLGANPLQPVATATSVRVRAGKTLVTDGPFAETREQLGGYYLVDAPDLDEAICIAARIPPASVGTIEIRPIVELPAMPAEAAAAALARS